MSLKNLRKFPYSWTILNLFVGTSHVFLNFILHIETVNLYCKILIQYRSICFPLKFQEIQKFSKPVRVLIFFLYAISSFSQTLIPVRIPSDQNTKWQLPFPLSTDKWQEFLVLSSQTISQPFPDLGGWLSQRRTGATSFNRLFSFPPSFLSYCLRFLASPSKS